MLTLRAQIALQNVLGCTAPLDSPHFDMHCQSRATTKMRAFNWIWTLTILMIFLSIFMSENCQFCDDSSKATISACARLSKDLENALFGDEGNLFRMRKAFFYSPTASPVLLKVVYNVTYGDNVTIAITDDELPCCHTSFTQDKATKEPQSCTNTAEGSGENTTLDVPDYFSSSTVENASICIPEEVTNCSNSIEFKEKSCVYGWTSTGVYAYTLCSIQ